MDFGEWINKLPLWAVFVCTLAICMATIHDPVAQPWQSVKKVQHYMLDSSLLAQETR